MKVLFTGFPLKQAIVRVTVTQFERVSNDHCRNILLKYYNKAVHVLYKTQEMWFSRSASKNDGGKVARCLHSHVKWCILQSSLLFCNVQVTV